MTNLLAKLTAGQFLIRLDLITDSKDFPEDIYVYELGDNAPDNSRDIE